MLPYYKRYCKCKYYMYIDTYIYTNIGQDDEGETVV